MKSIIIGAVLAFAVSTQAEMVTVQPFQDGARIMFNPAEIIAKVKELKAQEKTSYVEYIALPKAGYNVYADRGSEGRADVPQVIIIESNKEPVGIFQATGDSISKNPWAWAAGTAVAVFGAYKLGDNYGWWDRGGDDDGGQAQPQIINNGGIIVIAGDGSPVNVDTSTSTSTTSGDDNSDDHSNPDPVTP